MDLRRAKRLILAVDDDPVVLKFLQRILMADGEYDVVTASSGREALALICQDCPDFIITDWEMPEMDGIHFCRQVRRMQLPHYVYIFFLTVRSTAVDLVEALNAGCDSFMNKELAVVELTARMKAGERVLLLEERLTKAARTDALTNLLNRGAFLEQAEKEWNHASNNAHPLSLITLDLDYFKRLNDQHGHQFGDQVLRETARCLKEASRANDHVSRFGGEEFCILLPDTDVATAVAVAETARTAIREIPQRLGIEIDISASFGIAEKCDCLQSEMELLKAADEVLYEAKGTGRDRVNVFQAVPATGI